MGQLEVLSASLQQAEPLIATCELRTSGLYCFRTAELTSLLLSRRPRLPLQLPTLLLLLHLLSALQLTPFSYEKSY
jgi:hypothetical protein